MSGKIKVGVAGWSYKDWEGIVYPASLKSAGKLAYIAQYFDLVEINTSFYGPIKPETGREWCRIVADENPNFVFTAKLYRGFTHSPIANVQSTSAETIRPESGDEADTKRGFDVLASQGRLGAVLAQFPISFKYDDENRAYLEKLLPRFSEYPLVLEIRHSSWNRPEVLEWLASTGVGLCNIDQPLLGRAIRPAAHATSAVGYVRLHGRNYKNWFAESNVRDRYDYLYSEKELDHWKEHRRNRRANRCHLRCRQQSQSRQSRRECAGTDQHAAREQGARAASAARSLSRRACQYFAAGERTATRGVHSFAQNL
jgi:uncharacterized protein YecE (DUF72 family)